VSEKIEMVRRELVLKGLGKEVPAFPNGTINIQKLLQMTIEKEKERELTNSEKKARSPLKSLRDYDQVISKTESVFPLN
jgi:hypothetical protein